MDGSIAGIEGLKHAVGSNLGYSEWLIIDQARIDRFAEVTGDSQWIHVDPVRASGSPFGAPVAHGFLIVSVIPMLVRQIMRVESVSMAINYGLNRVRFPSPVRVDSRIRAGATILSVDVVERGATVVSAISIEIEGASKPACVAEVVSLYVP